jgi:hypothetical protein
MAIEIVDLPSYKMVHKMVDKFLVNVSIFSPSSCRPLPTKWFGVPTIPVTESPGDMAPWCYGGNP